MKKIFTLTFMFLSFSIYADQSQVDLCVEQGHSYGDGHGNDLISSDCFDLFKTLSTEQANAQTKDGSLEFVGYKNILFMKDGNDLSIIAGHSTGLNNIKAVTIDEKNNEIVVLQENGDILFFSMIITGNVAAYRTIKTQELHGATDITVDKNHVMALKSSTGEILFYDRKADFNRRLEKQNLDIKRSIAVEAGKHQFIDLGESGDLNLKDKADAEAESISL